MENKEEKPQPIFSHVEPVLAVKNVLQTIEYWQNVLGFPTKWIWGEPPTIGAVSWQKVHVQFYKDEALAESSKGNSVWIRLQRIEELYKFHQEKNAEIIEPLESKPLGMSQYMLRDINGYFICFAGIIPGKEKSESNISHNITIIERTPSINEYRKLASAVGWSPSTNDEVIKKILAPALFAVVAKDTTSGEIIGCALLLGDGATFYYVKDVMVHPTWQRKHVGTLLMQALNNWLEENAADNALVALITGENLEPFYQQFNFLQAFSMLKYIQRKQ
jgi:GNAT superfamily N-acetyltransferase